MLIQIINTFENKKNLPFDIYFTHIFEVFDVPLLDSKIKAPPHMISLMVVPLRKWVIGRIPGREMGGRGERRRKAEGSEEDEENESACASHHASFVIPRSTHHGKVESI